MHYYSWVDFKVAKMAVTVGSVSDSDAKEREIESMEIQTREY